MSKQSKNYVYSLAMAEMNTAVIVLVLVIFVPLIVFNRAFVLTADLNPFFFIGIMFWFILHELIHGLSYRLSKGVKGSDIAFGAKIEKGILFCTCKKTNLKKRHYQKSVSPSFCYRAFDIDSGGCHSF